MHAYILALLLHVQGDKKPLLNIYTYIYIYIYISSVRKRLSFYVHYVSIFRAVYTVNTKYERRDLLTLRRLMSYIYIYIYGAPILDVSRSRTTTQHSR